jgi:hypothetical protein
MSGAFEINSPSKATMRMGLWLMEGISQGISKGKVDLSPLEAKVLNPIRTKFAELKDDLSGFLDYLNSETMSAYIDPTKLYYDPSTMITKGEKEPSEAEGVEGDILTTVPIFVYNG